MKLIFDECSYQDFLTLIFIYAASVDLDFSEEEKEEIINKVGKDSYLNSVINELISLSNFITPELKLQIICVL